MSMKIRVKYFVSNAKQNMSPSQMTKKSLSPFQESMQRFRRDRRAMISLGVLLFLVLLTIVGPPIYKRIGGTYEAELGGSIGPAVYHRYDYQELTQQNQGPSGRYWLGTDALGRDMLARLMQGMLISLIVAFLVEAVDIGLGLTVGVLAGYYGGWIAVILARFMDLIFAFPRLLFAVLLTAVLGARASDPFANWPLLGPFLANGNASLVIVSLALSLVSWPLMARYVRSRTLQIKQQAFIEAARASGARDRQIMLRHIVPNLFSFVLIASSLNIADTIISEAGLSFLGLGVREPGSSLGLMIANGLGTLEVFPWNALCPALILTIIVLAVAFVSDGLRDAFDPHTGSSSNGNAGPDHIKMRFWHC
jgi:ABC-type dipeptide/oligopeptide/nickel transport system permease subunit